MKYLAALLFFVTAPATGIYAIGSGPPPSTNGPSNASKAASFNDEDTLLHRPTPTPGPAAADPKGPKKPLTATLGKDNTGKESLTAFASTDPKIYLVWKDDTGTKGDKVRIAWYAEDTGGKIAKNKKLTEATQTVPGPGSFGASYLVMPTGGFPAGKYRVDVYDGTKLAKSLNFTVKK